MKIGCVFSLIWIACWNMGWQGLEPKGMIAKVKIRRRQTIIRFYIDMLENEFKFAMNLGLTLFGKAYFFLRIY